jgi:hypothetical protein
MPSFLAIIPKSMHWWILQYERNTNSRAFSMNVGAKWRAKGSLRNATSASYGMVGMDERTSDVSCYTHLKPLLGAGTKELAPRTDGRREGKEGKDVATSPLKVVVDIQCLHELRHRVAVHAALLFDYPDLK